MLAAEETCDDVTEYLKALLSDRKERAKCPFVDI
jgi:hypothetical protein